MVNLVVLDGCSTIQLTRGQNTLIDARDYERFVANKWKAQPMDRADPAYYAMRTFSDGHGKKLRTRMHRAVLEAHVGPCPPGLEPRHLNGDSLDNRSGNLAWGTHSENCRDAIRHGTFPGLLSKGRPNPLNRGERNGSAKLKPSDIPVIRGRFAAGESMSSIAGTYRVSRMAIWKIIEGKSWSHVA